MATKPDELLPTAKDFMQKLALAEAEAASKEAAKQAGANAVINIVSYYKKNENKSASQYECHAGAVVAGVALISNGVFLIYSYLLARLTSPSNYFNLASLLSAIVIGMCVGFLPHNWRPAKIFMGDSGAMLLGLLMATSALTVTGQIDPHMAGKDDLVPAFIPLILPLAILMLPLLDFTMAVLRRLRAGKSPFAADRQHIHHRLQDLGHSHVGSVLVFYIWTALISLSCLLFFFWTWPFILLFFVLGGAGATVFTLWPLLKKRIGAKVA